MKFTDNLGIFCTYFPHSVNLEWNYFSFPQYASVRDSTQAKLAPTKCDFSDVTWLHSFPFQLGLQPGYLIQLCSLIWDLLVRELLIIISIVICERGSMGNLIINYQLYLSSIQFKCFPQMITFDSHCVFIWHYYRKIPTWSDTIETQKDILTWPSSFGW